jgi:hypothetical protein
MKPGHRRTQTHLPTQPPTRHPPMLHRLKSVMTAEGPPGQVCSLVIFSRGRKSSPNSSACPSKNTTWVGTPTVRSPRLVDPPPSLFLLSCIGLLVCCHVVVGAQQPRSSFATTALVSHILLGRSVGSVVRAQSRAPIDPPLSSPTSYRSKASHCYYFLLSFFLSCCATCPTKSICVHRILFLCACGGTHPLLPGRIAQPTNPSRRPPPSQPHTNNTNAQTHTHTHTHTRPYSHSPCGQILVFPPPTPRKLDLNVAVCTTTSR